MGGVFGEDYLRIDASHTLEASRCRIVYTLNCKCIYFTKLIPPPEKMRVIESDYVTLIWCSKGL